MPVRSVTSRAVTGTAGPEGAIVAGGVSGAVAAVRQGAVAIRSPRPAVVAHGFAHPSNPDREWVFIGSQPVVDNAAISYTEAPDYPGLYLQSVNVL